MEYDFVKEPSRPQVHVLNEQKVFDSRRSPNPIPPEYSAADQLKIDEYPMKLAEFKRAHHWFVEYLTDDHMLSYIEGHRGGVVFPWPSGLTSGGDASHAAQVLSQLKTGTYKRKDGLSYSYEAFSNDVNVHFKDKLRRGWLRNC